MHKYVWLPSLDLGFNRQVKDHVTESSDLVVDVESCQVLSLTATDCQNQQPDLKKPTFLYLRGHASFNLLRSLFNPCVSRYRNDLHLT